MHKSAPQCLSWMVKPFLRARIEAHFVSFADKLHMIVAVASFHDDDNDDAHFFRASALLLNLYFQNATAEMHLLWTWYCMYQPGMTLGKSSEKGLDQ